MAFLRYSSFIAKNSSCIAIKRRYIDATESATVHYTSADEAINIVRRGLARYVVVYHPINIELSLQVVERVLNCNKIKELFQ